MSETKEEKQSETNSKSTKPSDKDMLYALAKDLVENCLPTGPVIGDPEELPNRRLVELRDYSEPLWFGSRCRQSETIL